MKFNIFNPNEEIVGTVVPNVSIDLCYVLFRTLRLIRIVRSIK